MDLEYKTQLFWRSTRDGRFLTRYINREAKNGWTLHSIATSPDESTIAYLVVLWREKE